MRRADCRPHEQEGKAGHARQDGENEEPKVPTAEPAPSQQCDEEDEPRGDADQADERVEFCKSRYRKAKNHHLSSSAKRSLRGSAELGQMISVAIRARA